MSHPSTGGQCLKTGWIRLPVWSAVVYHLPQLVLFHFVTVSAVNSRNGRNKNHLSELLSWKSVHHKWKTSELARSAASLMAEMVLDMSDRVIAEDSLVCVCFTSSFTIFGVNIVNYKQLSMDLCDMRWMSGSAVCGHVCAYPQLPTPSLAHWGSLNTRRRMIQMFEDHKWSTCPC